MLHVDHSGKVRALDGVSKEIFVPSSGDGLDRGRLRVRHNVVEWRLSNGYVIDRTFTFSQPVIDVALVHFVDHPGHSVCILARPERMSIITPTGSTVDVPLPFQASSIFAMKKGLLIERSKTLTSMKMPVLFSLSNPFEEIKPIVVQIDPHQRLEECAFVSDPHEEIMLVSTEPSFVAFFHPDRNNFSLKAIATHPESPQSSSIVPEFVLHQVWESPSGPFSRTCSLFVTHDLNNSPILCIMDPTRFTLHMQSLVETPDSSVLVDRSSPLHHIPCRLSCPIKRIDSTTSNPVYDLLVITLQHQWILRRGTHIICGLNVPSAISSSPLIQRLQSTTLPETAEVHFSNLEVQRIVVSLDIKSPLLRHTFDILDHVLPTEVTLAWRVAIIPAGWNGFIASLIGAVGVAESRKPTYASAYDELIVSELYQKQQHSQPKVYGRPTVPQFKVPNEVEFDPQLLQQIHRHMELIFSTLHLFYEDLKLSKTSFRWLRPLGLTLGKLARHLGLTAYFQHYACDLGPERIELFQTQEPASGCVSQNLVSSPPLDIFAWIQQRMAIYQYNRLQTETRTSSSFSTSSLFPRTNHVVELYNILYPSTNSTKLHLRAQQVVRRLITIPNFEILIEDIPDGVALPLRYALTLCKHEPSGEWESKACEVIQRLDWVGEGHELADRKIYRAQDPLDDGFGDVIQWNAPIFPKDHRLKEVGRFLRSNKVMYLKTPRDSSLTEADVANLQQTRLLLLCRRSMSMPVARGMVTLGSLAPHSSSLLTSPLLIPPIPLAARIAETNAKTYLDTSGYKELTLWPQFHNGVATALRLPISDTKQITAYWILSHKPQHDDNDDQIAAHAGFMMGLGLLGHLHSLSQSSIYQYLSMDNELTSVGILLGLAASTVCNKDPTLERTVSRILSLHIPSLLPPAFSHVNITPSAQTAAVIGLGLLYHGSGNRNMTEILLAEMTASPIVMSPTSAQSTVDLNQKEGYALAAGIAVGLIVLGRKNDMGLADLQLEQKLVKYVAGGTHKVRQDPMNCVLRTKKRSPAVEYINVNVTAAGAALTLAFMYLQSNNERIIQQLKIPSSVVQMESIRPDLLFVRVVATNLVGWDSVVPSKEWVLQTQMPACLNNPAIDPSTIHEARINILAGACFSIGLKYAGTQNSQAKDILHHFISDYRSKPKPTELNRGSWERCLGVLAQSVALVMAGSGDLETFQTIRAILIRQKQDSTAEVTYGNHMAVSSALGLLFLGGGRCTLKTTPFAVAALVIALYPMYPSTTSDQKYHLQALRHLYVLAIDWTCSIETIDVDTGDLSPTNLIVWTDNGLKKLHTPCLLPAFHKLTVESSRHFPITIDLKDEATLSNRARIDRLKSSRIIYVKRKQGDMESPQLTMLQQFYNWFVKDKTQKRWSAFCKRVWQECLVQHKPNFLQVYLNSKHAEEAILSRNFSNTFMVSNLQLMYLHMELEAHVFQYEEHVGELGVAQLVNEDFILGYSNSLLYHFAQLNNPSTDSLEYCAYLRFIGAPVLMHLE
ncbi:hypothetical protein AeMF1_005867 [Aphanomyces euteiches]|nr:hypothetical protein AeMF1_005867 [Aphanomyces euteiches]KAH9190052.1 hypothetical protein AeNC1_007972 [Aphanomyces euteiches]